MGFIRKIRRNKIGNLIVGCLSKAYHFLYFPYWRIKQRILFFVIDKKSPFKGELGEYGYFHSEISLKSISILETIYKSNRKNIFFSVDSIDAIKEIFSG